MTEPAAAAHCRSRGAVLERWKPLPDGRVIAAVFSAGVIRSLAVSSLADLDSIIRQPKPRNPAKPQQEPAP